MRRSRPGFKVRQQFKRAWGRLPGLRCVSWAHHPVQPHADARSSVAAVCYVKAQSVKRCALTAVNVTKSFTVWLPEPDCSANAGPFALHQRRKPGHHTGRAEWSRESPCGAFYCNHNFAVAHLPASRPAGPRASGQRRGDLGDWFKCPALSLGDDRLATRSRKLLHPPRHGDLGALVQETRSVV
jgi:hypothetical protein